MYALIETKGASHIAINVPTEGADKSLPAIAAMLEHNATFIRAGWRECETVVPAMSIQLGNVYRAGNDSESQELLIHASPEVLDDSFVIAAPEVFVSNKKALEKKDAEITRLRNELASTKDALSIARAEIERLNSDEEIEA